MASDGPNHRSGKSGRHLHSSLDIRTQPLWPVHLKPLPDELLSSWLVRLARAHGLKVHTFGRLVFGAGGQRLWTRDIDRVAPQWLLDQLGEHTGTTAECTRLTTLKAYEGHLYPIFRESFVLKWILPLLLFQTTHKGFGLQFCPRCLMEDPEPYYRKRWRVAFYTWCSRHNTMLHDRCPKCGAPVVFQRRELGQFGRIDGGAITLCHACDFNLSSSPVRIVTFLNEAIGQESSLAIRYLEDSNTVSDRFNPEYFDVLHQLCRLMVTRYRNLWLREFVSQRLGMREPLFSAKAPTFEMRPIEERHLLTQMGFWLMSDTERLLTDAWHAGSVSYSMLLRDFEDRPDWFFAIVERFADWRQRNVLTP